MRSDYRKELKLLSIEQLEERVDKLLDLVLIEDLLPHKPSTSYIIKHSYAKALLAKRKQELIKQSTL